MAALRNARRELFALAIAVGKPASRAYEEAGYRNNDGNSGRLNRNEQIRQRVSELQKESAMANKISRDDIVNKLLANIEDATEAKQHAAAGASIERLAKLLGMWTDRQEIWRVSEFDSIDNPDELRQRLIEMARGMNENAIADALEEGKPH
jgi:hypothetical protein